VSSIEGAVRRMVSCLEVKAVVADFDADVDVPTVKVPADLLDSVGPVEACAKTGVKAGDFILLASKEAGTVTYRPVRPEEERLAGLESYNVVSRLLSLLSELALEGVEGERVGTLCVVSDEAEGMYRTTLPIRVEGVNVMTEEGGRVLKALSRLDGAIVINSDGSVEAVGAIFDVNSDSVRPGLGARHTTALHVSRELACPVIVLSESGRVRLYYRGKEVLEVPARGAPRGPSADDEEHRGEHAAGESVHGRGRGDSRAQGRGSSRQPR